MNVGKAVFAENAEKLTIRGCKFEETGSNAVMLSRYNKGYVICHNEMHRIGASGILIAGSEDAVRDPYHWDRNDCKTEIHDWMQGPKSENYSRDCVISKNHIYDIGMYEKRF
ncbi:MAG: hypothetical protein ACI4EG_06565 [Fusicatenibacter sp.]